MFHILITNTINKINKYYLSNSVLIAYSFWLSLTSIIYYIYIWNGNIIQFTNQLKYNNFTNNYLLIIIILHTNNPCLK